MKGTTEPPASNTGAEMTVTCPNCGSELDEDSRYILYDGTPQYICAPCFAVNERVIRHHDLELQAPAFFD